MKISTLLFHLDHGSLSLPSFAREYVWKPSQAISLFNSLYRVYPVGSFIFWTPTSPTSARLHEPVKDARPVELIVDGQQRIAAIYSAMRGHVPGFLDAQQRQLCPLCFHIENAVFGFYRPDMKGDPHWINLPGLFNGGQIVRGEILDGLYQATAGPTRIGEYSQRLNQLGSIMDRYVHVDYLPNGTSPEEAAEIYLLANGGGGRK